MGVMLGMLRGNLETVEAHNAAMGKVIASVAMEHEGDRYHSMGESPGDTLVLRFDDGTGIRFYDDGQSCCEHRYMHTDDDLAHFVGAAFMGAELRDGPEVEGDYDVKECQFLLVNTSVGAFTMANYNEHNGYYGGFMIVVHPTEVSA